MPRPAAILSLLMLLLLPLVAGAAPARLDIAASGIAAGTGRGAQRLTVALAFGRPLAYRTRFLDAPPRLVLDLKDAAFGPADASALPGDGLMRAVRWGALGDGWSRLVAELPGPMRLLTAATSPEGVLTLTLEAVAPEAFRPDGTGVALPELWGLPAPAAAPAPAARPAGALRVMLDPGHGGNDPGAQAAGVSEAALMLTLAQEVAAALARRGAEPLLTRDADRFLPLEARMTAARRAQADLLISLHADVLPQGEAAGAAVFVWAADTADRAAAELASRHDRDDLLAGMDLAGADDEVAGVLMGLARTDTGPRSDNLASFLVSRLALGGLAIHKRPVKAAGFSVLKAPDIPSVLVETGFLSDAVDRANLTDPAWRARLAEAIADAAVSWGEDDAARDPLLRR